MRIKWTLVLLALFFAFSVDASYGQEATQPKSTLGEKKKPMRIPEGVQAFRDLLYVTNGSAAQTLDLYVPTADKGKGPWPLLIWIHGGGWQNGSKENCLPLRSNFTDRGYAVASLNYRLTGEAIFPAQIEDCKAAVRWLRAHAAQYGLDAQHFGVWGSSAGGHLVALMGTSGEAKVFDVGGNLEQSSAVQAVCDFYGPTDLAQLAATPGYERHADVNSPGSKLFGGAVKDRPEQVKAANPITYITADDPPFLIVHGTLDGVVAPGQSELLFGALQKAGVESSLKLLPGAKHGGPEFSTPAIQTLITDFFDKALKPKSTVADVK